MISTAFNKVTGNLRKDVISIGTRDTIVYFMEQIRKSCRDQEKYHSKCVDIDKAKLYELKKRIDKNQIKNIEDVYNLLELTQKEDQNAFAQAIFKVVTDFSLNTDGKSEFNFKAAIMPVNTELNTIELPGGEIDAFGGFASLKARKYSFEFAKLSTLLSLKEKNGFRMVKNKEGVYKGKPFIVSNDLKKLENSIRESINNVNFFDDNDAYSKDLEANLFTPSMRRLTGVLMSNKILSYIFLKVPFVATTLFGSVLLPLASIFRKAPWRGANIINDLIRKGSDQVKYIALEPVTLSILSDAKLNRKFYVKCEGDKKTKKLEMSR